MGIGVKVIGPLARETALRRKEQLSQRVEEFYNKCHDENGKFCEVPSGQLRRSRPHGAPGSLTDKQADIWSKYKTEEHRDAYVKSLQRQKEVGTTPPKVSTPSKAPIGGPCGPQKDVHGWAPYGTNRPLIGAGHKSHLRDRLLEAGITQTILPDSVIMDKIRTERPIEVKNVHSSKIGQEPVWVYKFKELDTTMGFSIDQKTGGITTAFPVDRSREELKQYLTEKYRGRG